MSSHVIREGHVCSYDRALTTNDTVIYQRCELNSSSTNEILNQETMNREKQEDKQTFKQMINKLFLDTNVTHTDEVTRTKKYRKTPINERDNNITKIITKHNNNDKPLTEKAKENSIQIADKKSRDQTLSNWLRAKVLQRKSEEEMRRYENEEQQHLNVVHSREACEQAFKQWLKRKNREAKEQKRRAKERMKITRQLMRGNHDWQQFMKNIRKFDVFKILL
ncbi:unnamed protein product [Schistosoma guineensis]|nr:unnamed protein product [Schistosoma guineensis]